VFSFIRTVLLKALTSLIRCSKAVTSKENSTLLTTADNIFRFVNLYKEDVSVIRNSKH